MVFEFHIRIKIESSGVRESYQIKNMLKNTNSKSPHDNISISRGKALKKSRTLFEKIKKINKKNQKNQKNQKIK